MQISLGVFEPVADRVYVAVAEPETVNIGLVVGTTGALLVDTGSTPGQGAAIRAAAQAVAGDVPLTHVVITHGHHDHVGGLDAFADLITLGHRGLDAPVTQSFGLVSAVDLGDCHVELVHFGRGHTDHDVTAVVAARGVVFFGDLLETLQAPQAGDDAWPAEWPKTLDGTLGTLQKGYVVVPGHGPMLDREGAFIQRAEIHWHHDKAVELHDAGREATGAWQAEGWPWGQAGTEQFLARALTRLAESGRPRKRARTLPLLNR